MFAEKLFILCIVYGCSGKGSAQSWVKVEKSNFNVRDTMVKL